MNTETTDQTIRRLIKTALEELQASGEFRAQKNTASYSVEDAKADAEEAATDEAEFVKNSATFKALKADADGSAQTVKELRKMLQVHRKEAAEAEARLLEIAAVIRHHSFGISEQAHSALSVALYKNSI